MWQPHPGWMTPKTDACINCGMHVDKERAGYIVWDWAKEEFRRQHAECRQKEDAEREHRRFRPAA